MLAQTIRTQRRRQARQPADYHAYVFRNGKLLGDFDNMYRYAKDIPWHQDTLCGRWHADVGRLMLKEHAPYESILEIGCGLDYFTATLKPLAAGQRAALDAFDVSSEAIRRARGLHSGIRFYVDDVTAVSFRPKRQYALVVVRDVFWYVFPHLEIVLSHLEGCLKPGGWLYVCQSFPALESAFIGKEVIPTPEALLAHMRPYEPVHTACLRDHRLKQDGPILHFLGVRRK